MSCQYLKAYLDSRYAQGSAVGAVTYILKEAKDKAAKRVLTMSLSRNALDNPVPLLALIEQSVE